jgi:hypothetical protein
VSRKKLPTARASTTFEFAHRYPGGDDHTFTASAGFYPDGKLGEAVLQLVDGTAKQVTVDARDATVLLSLAIQLGGNVHQIGRSMSRDEDGNPHGFLASLCDALEEL